MARIAGHHVPASALALFGAEATVVAVSACGGSVVGMASEKPVWTVALACALVLQLVFYFSDLYDVRVASNDAQRGRRLLLALGAVFVIAAPLTWLLPPDARPAVPFALTAAAVGAAALRALAPWEPLRARVLVVGQGKALEVALAEMKKSDDVVLGVERNPAADLVARARRVGAQLLVTAFDEGKGTIPAETLLGCRFAGIAVAGAMSHVQATRRKIPLELLRPSALIYDDGFTPGKLNVAGHRLISLVAGSLIFLLSAPILALAALAVRLGSPGPVIYRQVRVGRGGKPFTMLKLRTMCDGAEKGTGAVWAQKSDPRITRVGSFLRRTRLDELPQILNVLRGDMDLVGPRPERPELVSRLAQLVPFYEVRHLVRPGLTGWAQICYPYGASVEDARQKLAYDIYYVKNASPILDLIVLFHTAKVVITGRGAR